MNREARPQGRVQQLHHPLEAGSSWTFMNGQFDTTQSTGEARGTVQRSSSRVLCRCVYLLPGSPQARPLTARENRSMAFPWIVKRLSRNGDQNCCTMVRIAMVVDINSSTKEHDVDSMP
eukprot:s692_g4.t1